MAWALVALSAPGAAGPEARGAIDQFIDDDGSDEYRRSKLLLAGLSGLGRIAPADMQDFAGRLSLNLSRETRWSRMITRAAEIDNRALVALLAGLGMQGEAWDKMTARHLYHIVSSLRRVGMEAEARMIAAEAIARG